MTRRRILLRIGPALALVSVACSGSFLSLGTVDLSSTAGDASARPSDDASVSDARGRDTGRGGDGSLASEADNAGEDVKSTSTTDEDATVNGPDASTSGEDASIGADAGPGGHGNAHDADPDA